MKTIPINKQQWFVILHQEEIESFKSANQLAVYAAIKSYASNGKFAIALSFRQIKCRTSLSVGTVYSTVKELIRINNIRVVGTESKIGGKVPVYEITNPPQKLNSESVQYTEQLASTNAPRLSVQSVKESVQPLGTKVIQSNKVNNKETSHVLSPINPRDRERLWQLAEIVSTTV